MNGIVQREKVTVESLLFTLSSSIWAVRKILKEDFGMSEVKANMAILIAVDAEKQLSMMKDTKNGAKDRKRFDEI